MRAVVTGGSGVVGQAIVAHLIASGDHVTVLTRSARASRTVRELGADSVGGDILDYPSCVAAFADAEVVFHVAGLNEMCPSGSESLRRVNVDGTRTVVRAAAASGANRLVYTSSVAAYEARPSAYGLSKLHGEQVAFAEAQPGLDVVAVSPSSVQGPGRSGGTAKLLLAVLEGRLRFLPDTTVSIVDIEDCAKAHRLAATQGRPGASYVVGGATVATTEIAELRDRIGLPPGRVSPIPRWLFRAFLPIAALRPTIGGIRVCPDMLAAVTERHHVDGTAAAEELGFRYTPVEETLRNLVEWASSAAP